MQFNIKVINVTHSDSQYPPFRAAMQFFDLPVKQEVEESMWIYSRGEGTECTMGKAIMRGCLISDEKTLKEILIKTTL